MPRGLSESLERVTEGGLTHSVEFCRYVSISLSKMPKAWRPLMLGGGKGLVSFGHQFYSRLCTGCLLSLRLEKQFLMCLRYITDYMFLIHEYSNL